MAWSLATSGDICKAQTPPHVFCARPSLVLTTCILASSLAFVDGSVVNVGLPAIGQSLHGDAADLQWVVNAYLLPLSALLLTGGALGDRLGRRSVLIAGIALRHRLCSVRVFREPRMAARSARFAGSRRGAALAQQSRNTWR